MKEQIKYSPLEKRILAAIPEDGTKISTLGIVSQVYLPGEAPRNARQSILTAVNSLISKSDENEEKFEIFKSRQRGSQPVVFWREERIKRVKNDREET